MSRITNIIISNTTKGTTTNPDGDYTITLDEGEYKVVYQYIGYQSKEEIVRISNKEIVLNIYLEPEKYKLTEVTVFENSEDPAYSIIRNTIAKRAYYEDLISSWECHAYVKGMQKIANAPEKIFGIELGDLNGSLDSNRQGIVYLSESESTLFYQAPSSQKEVMISSIVSGDDNGFSFNRASSFLGFSLYANTINLFKPIVSPIADNALSYYQYQLEASYFDVHGREINRIKLTPKRKDVPLLSGYLQIVDGLWLLESIDLFLTGKSIQQPGLDTLHINQVYVPSATPDYWPLFSQRFDLKISVMGFEVVGYFLGVFTDYEIGKNYPPSFFKGEVFKVKDSANVLSGDYWEKSRPVPLSAEEKIDYRRKDSIMEIRNDPVYLDSIEREGNKFHVDNIINGYSNSRAAKLTDWGFGAPLNSFTFNSVQGWNFIWQAVYRKYKDKEKRTWWNASTEWNIGFADKNWRGIVKLEGLLNAFDNTAFSIEGGRAVRPFNGAASISAMHNYLYSLFGKENYLRLYDNSFISGTFKKEVVNGFEMKLNLEVANRSALQNNTQYSFFKKDEYYFPNDPFASTQSSEPAVGFVSNQLMLTGIELQLRPFQKYAIYPTHKRIIGSTAPELRLSYQKAIPLNEKSPEFDRIQLTLKDDWQVGLVGKEKFILRTGTFLNKKNLYFMDLFHFMGNQTIINRSSQSFPSFMLLPYFTNSTASSFVEMEFTHDFDGFFFQKIPLIRNFGWNLEPSFRLLSRQDENPYSEFSLGIKNIGFKWFRLLRLDYAWAFKNGKVIDRQLLIGLNMNG